MDQVSQIRAKHLLDRLLTYCDNTDTEEDKAVLLRISVITLNKLRIHADVDISLGSEVRSLNKQLSNCKNRQQLLTWWDHTIELVEAYMDVLSSAPVR